MPDLQPITFTVLYALVIVCAFPFADLARMRRLQRHTSAAARLGAYRFVIVLLWSATAIVFVLAPPNGLLVVPRGAGEFGWLYAHPWADQLSLLLPALLLILVVAPGVQCIGNESVRKNIAAAMKDLRFMLPVSSVERRWWLLLSVSAGVCEECIYRGFLLEFLRARLDGGPPLGLGAALLLSAIAFGTAHLYQGAAGMVKTTVVGLLFGMLAVVTGSLLLPILCHILLDAQILWMYRPAEDAPDEARILIAGCTP